MLWGQGSLFQRVPSNPTHPHPGWVWNKIAWGASRDDLGWVGEFHAEWILGGRHGQDRSGEEPPASPIAITTTKPKRMKSNPNNGMRATTTMPKSKRHIIVPAANRDGVI